MNPCSISVATKTCRASGNNTRKCVCVMPRLFCGWVLVQSGMTHGKSDMTRSKETITSMKRGPKSGGDEVQIHIVYYTRRSAFLISNSFSCHWGNREWHENEIDICCCSVSSQLLPWVFYLCATPNFGKIGAQAATPPSLPTKKLFLWNHYY